MLRSTLALVCLATLAACVEDPTLATAHQDVSLGFSREHVTADIYHYELVVPIGPEPNAALRLHRVVREVAPFVPRPTTRAVMLLHGDAATFVTSFVPTLGDPTSAAPGLAPYLAAAGLDVWGLDRRWTLPGVDDDVSDFGEMGVAQELDDLRAALALVRVTRLATGGGGGKVALAGFSHGAQLAYLYASVEATRPAAQRHVKALVPIDFYGVLGPDQVDERAAICQLSADAYAAHAAGFVDSPNEFLTSVGALARTAPTEVSPWIPSFDNRGLMLLTVGRTYRLGVPYAPLYHLAAPILDPVTGRAIGLSESTEDAVTAWLAGGPPHASMLEAAELEALLCADGPPPIDAPLARITVPLFYLGAAGGVGDLGLYSTTQVGSTDVTTLVVQELAPAARAADFGHVDLLFAADAPARAWSPLATWLAQH